MAAETISGGVVVVMNDCLQSNPTWSYRQAHSSEICLVQVCQLLEANLVCSLMIPRTLQDLVLQAIGLQRSSGLPDIGLRPHPLSLSAKVNNGYQLPNRALTRRKALQKKWLKRFKPVVL